MVIFLTFGDELEVDLNVMKIDADSDVLSEYVKGISYLVHPSDAGPASV